MSKSDNSKAKREVLRQQGTLHSHPERVKDPLFRENSFFDPQDLIQVKYEMIRTVQQGDQSIVDAATNFGFSRPAFYEAQAALKEDGIIGLIPKKRGPQSGHKLSASIVEWMKAELKSQPETKTPELVEQIRKTFGVKVHARSIERALVRSKKK